MRRNSAGPFVERDPLLRFVRMYVIDCDQLRELVTYDALGDDRWDPQGR